MKTIIIHTLHQGKEKEILRCFFDGQELQFVGNQKLIDSFFQKGIKNYDTIEGEKLFPSDGLNFFLQIPNNFQSPYCWASEI